MKTYYFITECGKKFLAKKKKILWQESSLRFSSIFLLLEYIFIQEPETPGDKRNNATLGNNKKNSLD